MSGPKECYHCYDRKEAAHRPARHQHPPLPAPGADLHGEMARGSPLGPLQIAVIYAPAVPLRPRVICALQTNSVQYAEGAVPFLKGELTPQESSQSNGGHGRGAGGEGVRALHCATKLGSGTGKGAAGGHRRDGLDCGTAESPDAGLPKSQPQTNTRN